MSAIYFPKYLPKLYVSKAFPFLSVTTGSALPLVFPEAFSKPLGALGKVVSYNFSSLYGPLLNNLSSTLAPTLAVATSLASASFVGTFDVSVFSQRVGSVLEAGTDSSFISSVTPAKTGAQSHTQNLSDVNIDPAANSATLPWIPASAGMTKERAGMTKEGIGMTEGEAALTLESVQHPLTLTHAASQGASISANVTALGNSTVTPTFYLVTPAQAGAQSHVQSLTAEPRDAFQKAIEMAVDKMKRLLVGSAAQRLSGVTSAFFEKADWMKWEHEGWTQEQRGHLIEKFIRNFFAVLSVNPELVNELLCNDVCKTSQNRNNGENDILSLIVEQILETDFEKKHHFQAPFTKILGLLVESGILLQRDIDNLGTTSHYSLRRSAPSEAYELRPLGEH